jgi:thiol-disulfide isomerase/thioredoxin
MKPIEINFYTKENCPLCDKGKAVLMELAKQFPLNIHEIDIYKDERLLELYQIMIPVVEIAGKQVAYGIIDKETVRKRLLKKIG